MRLEIQNYLASRPEIARFVREQPIWYRLLSRSPEKVYEIEQEAQFFYGKTFPQRIERLQHQVQLAQMLMSMMYALNNNNP